MSQSLTVKRLVPSLGGAKKIKNKIPNNLFSICLNGMFESIRQFQSNIKWKQEHISDAMFLIATLFVLMYKMSFTDSYQQLLFDWDELLYSNHDDDIALCAAKRWRKHLSLSPFAPKPIVEGELVEVKTKTTIEWQQFCKQNQTLKRNTKSKSSSVSIKIHNATVALTIQYLSPSSLSISELFTECKQFVSKWNFEGPNNNNNKQQQNRTRAFHFALEPKHLSFKIYFVFHWLACSTDWGQTKLNHTHPRYSKWIESNILLHWFHEFGNIQNKFKNDIETIAELLGCFCMLGSSLCTLTTEMESWIITVVQENQVEQNVRSSKHYHAYYLLAFLLLLLTPHPPPTENQKRKTVM